MDVEGAEWRSLPNMMSSNILSRVKQLGFEIHVERGNVKKLYEYWTILDQLEKQGFRRWYWAMNFQGPAIYMESTAARSCCYEMVYINVKFLHKDAN